MHGGVGLRVTTERKYKTTQPGRVREGRADIPQSKVGLTGDLRVTQE